MTLRTNQIQQSKLVTWRNTVHKQQHLWPQTILFRIMPWTQTLIDLCVYLPGIFFLLLSITSQGKLQKIEGKISKILPLSHLSDFLLLADWSHEAPCTLCKETAWVRKYAVEWSFFLFVYVRICVWWWWYSERETDRRMFGEYKVWF